MFFVWSLFFQLFLYPELILIENLEPLTAPLLSTILMAVRRRDSVSVIKGYIYRILILGVVDIIH